MISQRDFLKQLAADLLEQRTALHEHITEDHAAMAELRAQYQHLKTAMDVLIAESVNRKSENVAREQRAKTDQDRRTRRLTLILGISPLALGMLQIALKVAG